MAKTKKLKVDRRGFLKGAAASAAGYRRRRPSSPEPARRRRSRSRNAMPPRSRTPLRSRPIRAFVPSCRRESSKSPAPTSWWTCSRRSTSNIVAANPGSTFEGLHESLINYGDNKMPEFLTCCHEESAVAMAHGYAKIEGKPMMALIHGDIGLQHASMAIYNAYADRVPIYMVVGNHADGARARAAACSRCTARRIMGALVRDSRKWDDQPYSLGHFAESAVRAYNIAMTPPMGPVLITMQRRAAAASESRSRACAFRNSAGPSPPQGDSAAVAEAAQLLVNAERPHDHRASARRALPRA